MAKKEIKNARQTIREKQVKLDVVQSIISSMEWDYTRAVESLEATEKNFKEFKDAYDEESEGHPMEEDYCFKDYIDSIERGKYRIETYEDVQELLMRLL